MNTIIQHYNEGGFFMHFILLCGIFSFAIILERIYALYFKKYEQDASIKTQVPLMVKRNDFAGALQLVTAQAVPVNRVMARALEVRATGGGDDEIQARMDEQLTQEVSTVDRNTGFLGMIGNVATLLGLLGTISGMISSFAAVASANPADRATLLSSGISEAMNCTAFGLIVAIPALVAYAIFQNKTDKVVANIVDTSTKFFNDIIFTTEAAGTTQNARPASKNVEGTI